MSFSLPFQNKALQIFVSSVRLLVSRTGFQPVNQTNLIARQVKTCPTKYHYAHKTLQTYPHCLRNYFRNWTNLVFVHEF
jgi:hypothetical protein